MKKIFSHFKEDLLSLFYPNLCCACGDAMQHSIGIICVECQLHLPQTDFHTDENNAMIKKFWGRIPVVHAASYLYFQKDSRVQNLLHELKYKGRTDVGETLGVFYGSILKDSDTVFKKADVILPVPLHYKKLRKRGYNQSDFFAKGLSKSMNIAWSDSLLQRNIFTETQTGKNRIERWENVEDIFELKNKENFEGKHIILVDDVVTTGATLEACANALYSKVDCAISILTIASAV
jgi:ComF family protein